MKILSKLCLALLASMLLVSMVNMRLLSIFTKSEQSLSTQSINIITTSLSAICYPILFQVFCLNVEKKSITTLVRPMRFTFIDGLNIIWSFWEEQQYCPFQAIK